EEEPRHESGGGPGQMRADGGHRPAFDAHGPGRIVSSEGHERFRPPAADEQDALASQEGGKVECAGILEATWARELEIQRHALTFPYRRGLTVERDLEPPRGRPEIEAVAQAVDVDEEPGPVRRPAHGLFGQASFHADERSERGARDVVRRERIARGAERS